MRFVSLRQPLLFATSLILATTLAASDHDTDKPAKKPPIASTAPKDAARDAALATKIMPLEQIKTGMRGVAYTVFEGTKPESMEVEILGVLKNNNGPKSDMILIRLHGQKVEFTGVVAGMSGSPVYIDGKLIGALAFRIGTFSKEPIAGVTPIEEMLEINELDKSVPAQSVFTPVPGQRKSEPVKSAVSGGDFSTSAGLTQLASYMTPIAAPLVFN